MKKGKILACIGLASLILPLCVSAEPLDITESKSSNIDATIESYGYTEGNQILQVSWGDFKFKYNYKSLDGGDVKIGSWSAASDGTPDTLASNRVQVLSTFVDAKKATLSFSPKINGVSAQVFGSVSNPTEVITTPYQQLEDGSVSISENETADYSVYLLGGEYEDVKSEFDNGSKKIGTFTLTIEDAQ